MDPMAECLTVNNMNTNKHVNLVQVKKIKAENETSTISLDIISGKCQEGKATQYWNCVWHMTFVLIEAHFLHRLHSASKEHRQSRITGHSNNSLKNLLLAFSWRQNLVLLSSEFSEHCIMDVIEISGLRVLCVLWILLVHVTTVLYFVAGKLWWNILISTAGAVFKFVEKLYFRQ